MSNMGRGSCFSPMLVFYSLLSACQLQKLWKIDSILVSLPNRIACVWQLFGIGFDTIPKSLLIQFALARTLKSSQAILNDRQRIRNTLNITNHRFLLYSLSIQYIIGLSREKIHKKISVILADTLIVLRISTRHYIYSTLFLRKLSADLKPANLLRPDSIIQSSTRYF
jgi:hypothetical protein